MALMPLTPRTSYPTQGPAGDDATKAATVPVGRTSREDARRASRKGRPFFLLLAVLVIVNAAAIWGQAGWFYEHATPKSWTEEFGPAARVGLAILLALAVELIGVYLSAEADEARRASAPAFSLQLGAYAFGGLAGYLNFQHWNGSAGGGSAELPIVFAALSAASPFLWAVWSKARHRAALRESGDAPMRGVRLSPARKVWHPLRSLSVIRHASWEGIADETTAVQSWAFTKAARDARKVAQRRDTTAGDEPVSAPPAGKRSKSDWWALAQATKAENPGWTWEDVARELECSTSWIRGCKRAVESGQNTGEFPALTR